MSSTPELGPDTPVQYLKGVGPRRAKPLERLGVHTVGDLVRHLPREHQDRRDIAAIRDLRPETHATVRGRIAASRTRRVGGKRYPRSVVTVTVDDGTGLLEAEFWQQRWRADQLTVGTEAFLSGRVTWERGPRMSSPDVEVIDADATDDPVGASRIVPIHPLTQGLHPAQVRRLVARALDAVVEQLVDPIPESLRSARDLEPLANALRQIHFPDDDASLARARRRLEYEELFLLQLGLAFRRRRHRAEEKPHRIEIDARLDARIRARFPFTLTGAQGRCIDEIAADLASPRPMNRLLQGDVGAGKTVVAGYAMLAAVARRLQAALLAPTEILAEQHRATFARFLAGSQVRIAMVSGGAKTKRRRATLDAVAAGEVDIVVGTHALMQQDVRFAALGLVIVDEQHKFGVLQRAALRAKGFAPDMLVMSATPIPRTLTMTLFGDLDVSVLDELPPGRQPIDTVLCDETDRLQAYDWVRREIARGRRAYHVAPLVEENEELPLKAAVQLAEELRAGPFAGIGVGLLHGRLKGPEKEAAMDAFRRGETPVLVCTSVVEVGVDVPEATVLIVEHAERFGLAQLHQLRGRIGRGRNRSRMILFHDAKSRDARARLDALASTTDGFRIAEADLRIRGPGEFLGTRQSGVPELQVASLLGDPALLVAAREDAFALAERDPDLSGEGAVTTDALRRFLARRPG